MRDHLSRLFGGDAGRRARQLARELRASAAEADELRTQLRDALDDLAEARQKLAESNGRIEVLEAQIETFAAMSTANRELFDFYASRLAGARVRADFQLEDQT